MNTHFDYQLPDLAEVSSSRTLPTAALLVVCAVWHVDLPALLLASASPWAVSRSVSSLWSTPYVLISPKMTPLHRNALTITSQARAPPSGGSLPCISRQQGASICCCMPFAWSLPFDAARWTWPLLVFNACPLARSSALIMRPFGWLTDPSSGSFSAIAAIDVKNVWFLKFQLITDRVALSLSVVDVVFALSSPALSDMYDPTMRFMAKQCKFYGFSNSCWTINQHDLRFNCNYHYLHDALSTTIETLPLCGCNGLKCTWTSSNSVIEQIAWLAHSWLSIESVAKQYFLTALFMLTAFYNFFNLIFTYFEIIV